MVECVVLQASDSNPTSSKRQKTEDDDDEASLDGDDEFTEEEVTPNIHDSTPASCITCIFCCF